MAGLFGLAGCSPLGRKSNVAAPATVVAETPVRPVAGKPGTKVFSELIQANAKADSGQFNLYSSGADYFLEIPDSLLGREVLIVSRIVRAAAGNRNTQAMTGYAGDQINESVIRFEKGPEGKLFMRSISFAEPSGDSTQVMYRSILNSNIQPITAAFEIKASSKTKDGVLIELTEHITGDNSLFFFSNAKRGMFNLGGYQADKSYVEKVSAGPLSLNIRTMKTYTRDADFATYELNTSILLLPKVPMRTRNADARIGYYSTEYTDFNSNPQGVDKVKLVNRWRLEPRKQDIEQYLAGELVEPAKPIVIYIDPATPKKWVPYLIQGVNDWQIAFEKAGFKNAIMAKQAPLGDNSWNLEDAGYSAIVYKPSEVANASGPRICDPRTGEILETHINWHHNIMKVLRNLYTIQAGAVDPRARQMQFDDELMGQLIRFVSSHEVGHTLGLSHNFGSSSTVPVDSLRNKKWVEANGHTPSIMDYARFNYVAQPEDGIPARGIFPRIGDYDKWAIEWGYRWYPAGESKEVEMARLNRWVIARTTANKRLWFGAETDPVDPRSQSEDLGDNAMRAGFYSIKNLKQIMPNIISWTASADAGYENAAELYKELLGQYGRYMGHVAKNIGGVMTTPKNREQKGPVVAYVSKAKQQEAMRFLQEQLFATPLWLLNKQLFATTGRGSIMTISRQQDAVLGRLLNQSIIYRLLQFEGSEPAKAYTAGQMLQDLQSGIFSELNSLKRISIYRRNLQKSYTEKLMVLLVTPPQAPPAPGAGASLEPDMAATDLKSVVKAQLRTLKQQIQSARPADQATKAHLQDLKGRIEKTLNIK